MFNGSLFFDARLRQPMLFAQPMAVRPFMIAAQIDDRQFLTVGTQSLNDSPVRPAVEE